MTGGGVAMPKTILVIDDDPAVLRAYGRLLGRLGHRVLLSGDGEVACHDAESVRAIDLVILDQRMPGATGLDLLGRLRRCWSLSGGGPTVFLVSAFLTDDLRERAARLGVAEVMEKPVRPDRLLASVAAVLGPAG
jgi:DNA-binding response OmpR family regulator